MRKKVIIVSVAILMVLLIVFQFNYLREKKRLKNQWRELKYKTNQFEAEFLLLRKAEKAKSDVDFFIECIRLLENFQNQSYSAFDEIFNCMSGDIQTTEILYSNSTIDMTVVASAEKKVNIFVHKLEKTNYFSKLSKFTDQFNSNTSRIVANCKMISEFDSALMDPIEYTSNYRQNLKLIWKRFSQESENKNENEYKILNESAPPTNKVKLQEEIQLLKEMSRKGAMARQRIKYLTEEMKSCAFMLKSFDQIFHSKKASDSIFENIKYVTKKHQIKILNISSTKQLDLGGLEEFSFEIAGRSSLPVLISWMQNISRLTTIYIITSIQIKPAKDQNGFFDSTIVISTFINHLNS